MVQGLATAFTLQRAGHSVIVLEKLNEKAMVCIPSLAVHSAYTHPSLQSFGKTSGPIR